MHGFPELSEEEWKQVKTLSLLFVKQADGKFSYLQCCIAAFMSWAIQNGVKIELDYGDEPIKDPTDGWAH